MQDKIIHSDPEIKGGAIVFCGTRVPAERFWDYIEAGDTIEGFLKSFPSVSREQAISLLQLARENIAQQHKR